MQPNTTACVTAAHPFTRVVLQRGKNTFCASSCGCKSIIERAKASIGEEEEGTGSNYPVFGGSLPHPHLEEEKGTRCTLLSEVSAIVMCDCPVEVITFKDIDFFG